MSAHAGLVAWDRGRARNQVIAAAMTAALTHRGPDAQGIWAAGDVAIGHARRTAPDTDDAPQPVTTAGPAGPVTVSLDGNIHSRQLHAELRAAGHTLTDSNATELVAAAYRQWDEAFVDHLSGVYTIALWDANQRSLLLVRDRIGVKPLYYHRHGTDLTFASQIVGLLTHPDITARLDTDGLGQLLAMAPMATPGHGVLHGIHELPPATIMRFDPTGMRLRRYWQLPTAAHRHDRITTVDHVRRLLTEAVASRTDPQTATLCSGGLDSSAVTALAAAAHDDPSSLHTFGLRHTEPTLPHTSPDPDDPGNDGAYALLAALHLHAGHHTVKVTSEDLLTAHEASLHAVDLPAITAYTASMQVLFTRIAVTHRAVLTGDGANELFRGYPMHQTATVDGSHRFPWSQSHPPLTQLLRRSTLRQVRPGRYARQQYLNSLEAMPATDGQPPRELPARRDMWLIWQHYLPYVLRRTERLSTAAGVRAHWPYLDHRLVEYVWPIPPSWHHDQHTTKTILRQVATGLLPTQITERRHHGYPPSQTSAYKDVLWQRARDLLTDTNAPVMQLLSAPMLAAFLNLHNGAYGDGTPLLHIAHVLELDAWLRKHHIEIL